MNKKYEIKAETIARLIITILVIANQILAYKGKDTIPFYENDIVQLVSALMSLATVAWGYWKNNSFTQAALQADELKDKLKELERHE